MSILRMSALLCALAIPAYAESPQDSSYAIGNGPTLQVKEWTPKGDSDTLCVAISNYAATAVSVSCVRTTGDPAVPISLPDDVASPPAVTCDPVSIAPAHQFYFGAPFGRFDTNGDGKVSLREFLAQKIEFEGKRSPEPSLILSEEEALIVFVRMDINGDGYVERADWPSNC